MDHILLIAYHSQHKKRCPPKKQRKKDAALDKGTRGKEHDRKLLELFDRRTNRGKVSTEDLSRDSPGLGGTFCDIGGYNFYFLWIDIKTYKNMSE